MTDKPKSDLSESLLIIHGAITRALKVAAENSELYKRQLPDRNTLDGFAMFIDCFTAILNGHHLSEDDIAFPYFKDKLPEMPFSRLMMEHQEMHGILKQIDRANSQIKSADKVVEGMAELRTQFAKMQQIWYPHINSEETHLCSDCVCSVITLTDQERLNKKLSEHSRRNSKPATLVLPFLLYNMAKKERERISAEMPWIVTRFLVPVVWKKKWLPMQPFLIK